MTEATICRRITLQRIGVLLVFSMFALGFAPSARADGFTTYTYTGLPFNSFFGVDSCTNGVGECNLSGSITFASPLPSNLSSLTAVTPLSFSFTDGVHTINNTDFIPNGDVLPTGFRFETGPDGQILGWWFDILLVGNGFPPVGYPPVTFDSLGCFPGCSFNQPGEGDNATIFAPQGSAFPTGSAYSPGGGTWTATPEPSSLLLLGTGLLGVLGAMRRKLLG